MLKVEGAAVLERRDHLIRWVRSVKGDWKSPAVAEPRYAQGVRRYHDRLSSEECLSFINFNFLVKDEGCHTAQNCTDVVMGTIRGQGK